MSRGAADRPQTSRDVPHRGGAEPALQKVENWLAECNRHPSTVMFALAVLMALQVSPWWYATPDSAAYLSVARSIAIHGTLSNLGNPHIAYPPGYPLLVSPTFLFAVKPFVLIGAIHWLLAV